MPKIILSEEWYGFSLVHDDPDEDVDMYTCPHCGQHHPTLIIYANICRTMYGDDWEDRQFDEPAYLQALEEAGFRLTNGWEGFDDDGAEVECIWTPDDHGPLTVVLDPTPHTALSSQWMG